jgi:hypothetical protein
MTVTGRAEAMAAPALALSGGASLAGEAQHVQRQATPAVPELNQGPLTAHVTIDAGSASQCQVLLGWWCVRKLGANGAALQPNHVAAVGLDPG